MQEEPRFIKKKVKSGSIDVHPAEKALVVNYEIEAAVIRENGEIIISDKRDCQKIIRLKGLNFDTDCASLAEDVINKCPLIHRSKLLDVEHLISYLKNRKDTVNADRGLKLSNDNISEVNNFTGGEKANLLNLESYVELLYEDMFEKIKGSSLILEIAKNHANLDELSKNESVLSALARVLREDWKKSLDLTINIVNVFMCFSMYGNFHSIIAQYKIGSLCMEIIQYELKRYCEMKNEISQHSEQTKNSNNAVLSKLPLPRSLKSAGNYKTRIPRSGIPVKERNSSNVNDVNKRAKTPDGRCKEQHISEALPVSNSLKLLPATESDMYGNKRKNLEKIIKKQNFVLQFCFNVLMNISDNEKIEDKIRKRNIVELLVLSLQADSVQLLIILVTYLKKLSVYRENKDQIINLNVIDKLPNLLTLKDTKLELAILQLMYNLSFDQKARIKYVKSNLILELDRLLDNGDLLQGRYVLGIIYHLTMDDEGKESLATTVCVSVFNQLASGRHTGNSNMLVLSICLNLALNVRCAEEMCKESHGIKTVMKHALENNDALAMKIIRNISIHPTTKSVFVEYAPSLLQTIIECEKEDFVLECIGILGNLSAIDVDFYPLLEIHDIVPFVKQNLTSQTVPDDLILELLSFLGTVIYDENCAEYFHQSGIMAMLIDLLKVKQEDDEIVLQIIYVFYQFLQHPFTRDDLIKGTDAPAYFIDLMHDNNPSIRKLCHLCLETIKEFDESWTDRIKTEKFQWHNSHWLEMIQNQILDKTSYPDDNGSDYFPHYNVLQNSSIFNYGSHMSLNVDSASSNLHSADSSRCLSRYDSETEDMDNEVELRKKSIEKSDPMKDALKNLVITNDVNLSDN